MNDVRYPLLKEIGTENGVDYVTLLNRMNCPPTTSLVLLKEMKKDDLIHGSFEANSTVSLTNKGIAFYLQLSQQLEDELTKHAEDKKQQRFQNKLSVASVLVPLVTFVLGIVLEYAAHILKFFVSLFS